MNNSKLKYKIKKLSICCLKPSSLRHDGEKGQNPFGKSFAKIFMWQPCNSINFVIYGSEQSALTLMLLQFFDSFIYFFILSGENNINVSQK